MGLGRGGHLITSGPRFSRMLLGDGQSGSGTVEQKKKERKSKKKKTKEEEKKKNCKEATRYMKRKMFFHLPERRKS